MLSARFRKGYWSRRGGRGRSDTQSESDSGVYVLGCSPCLHCQDQAFLAALSSGLSCSRFLPCLQRGVVGLGLQSSDSWLGDRGLLIPCRGPPLGDRGLFIPRPGPPLGDWGIWGWGSLEVGPRLHDLRLRPALGGGVWLPDLRAACSLGTGVRSLGAAVRSLGAVVCSLGAAVCSLGAVGCAHVLKTRSMAVSYASRWRPCTRRGRPNTPGQRG